MRYVLQQQEEDDRKKAEQAKAEAAAAAAAAQQAEPRRGNKNRGRSPAASQQASPREAARQVCTLISGMTMVMHRNREARCHDDAAACSACKKVAMTAAVLPLASCAGAAYHVGWSVLRLCPMVGFQSLVARTAMHSA